MLDWNHVKNSEECFLFHLKSSFCSQGMEVFVYVGKAAWLER